MQPFIFKINSHACRYNYLSLGVKLILSVCLIALYSTIFADSGSDLLQGTDTSFWATLNGTGKRYIYGAEFILAVATYIKSKNLLVFVGVIAIAVFFNILLKFVGQ
jgi:hypothetical protein